MLYRGGLFCLTTNSLFSKAKKEVPVVLSAVHTEVREGCPLALLSPLIYRLTVDCLAVDGQRRTTQEVASGVSSQAGGLASLQSFSDSLATVGNTVSMMVLLWSFSKCFCQSENAVSKWGVIKQLAGSMAIQSDRPWQMMSLGQHIICNFLLYERINKS